MSDIEDSGMRQVYPPRPTSAPHKVRPTKSIDEVPRENSNISNAYVIEDTTSGYTNNQNHNNSTVQMSPKRRMQRPLSSKGRRRQRSPMTSDNVNINDNQLRDADYNYGSISDGSSIKSYRSRRSVSSARSSRSNKSIRSNGSKDGRRRRYRRGSSARRSRQDRPTSSSRSRRRKGNPYAVPSSDGGGEEVIEVMEEMKNNVITPVVNNNENDNKGEITEKTDQAQKVLVKNAKNGWAKLRRAVTTVGKVKRKVEKPTDFHQPLELTYQDETKSLSYQYELSRLFEIHHKRMVSVGNCLDSSGDPLALQFRERLNKARAVDRCEDLDVPKTLKMKASHEQIRIWKNTLASYINRIDHVKSHIDTNPSDAHSYLSMMQAKRREKRLKLTSTRRYKIMHKKKLKRLERNWNDRTILS